MAYTPTLLVSGNAITAASVLAPIAEAENYLDGDVVAADLKTSSTWADYRHLYRPDFFGSPAPRSDQVTGDHHRRKTGSGHLAQHHQHADWGGSRPVWGGVATVWLPSTFFVSVRFSGWAYESGGDIDVASPNPAGMPLETTKAGVLSVKVDGGADVTGSLRHIYVNTDQNRAAGNTTMLGRKQVSIACRVSVTAGYHSIGVWLKVIRPATAPAVNNGRLAVDVRSFSARVLAR